MGVASLMALSRKSALLRILIILAQTNFPELVLARRNATS